MKNTILVFCFTLISIAAAQTDATWQKAVSLFAANIDWVPGNMQMDMQILNKEGEPESTSHYEYKIYADDKNNVQSELVKAFEGAKDVTEETREKENKEKENKDDKNNQEFGISSKDSPFHPDNQENVTFEKMGQEDINGIVCSKFEYRLKQKKTDQTGTAWLNAEGFPLRLSYTNDPLPKGMKKMLTTLHYNISDDNHLELSKMELTGTAGFLFIKKSFIGTFNFSKYWQKAKSM